MSDDLHSKRARPRRDRAADPAETDYSQRLALQLGPYKALPLPLCCFYTRIRLWDISREGNQQSESMLRRGDRVPVRRIHHHDASPRRRRHVDIVDADSGASDYAQLPRRIH